MSEFYNNDEKKEKFNYKLCGIIGVVLGVGAILLISFPVVAIILGVLGFLFSAMGKYSVYIIITTIGSILSIAAIVIGLYFFVDYSIYSVSGNKKELFKDNANVVQNYISSQYKLSSDEKDNYFREICGDDGKWCVNKTILFRVNDSEKILKNSGLFSYDFELNNSYFKVNQDNSVCVVLYSSSMGKYSDITKSVKSRGCRKLKFL